MPILEIFIFPTLGSNRGSKMTIKGSWLVFGLWNCNKHFLSVWCQKVSKRGLSFIGQSRFLPESFRVSTTTTFETRLKSRSKSDFIPFKISTLCDRNKNSYYFKPLRKNPIRSRCIFKNLKFGYIKCIKNLRMQKCSFAFYFLIDPKLSKLFDQYFSVAEITK